jgi:hypothetical protein
MTPFAELETAATCTLVTVDRPRPKRSRHDSLVELEEQIRVESKGASALVAVSKTGVIVDHTVAEKDKRKRDAEAAFGSPEDCPRRTRIRWDWKGESQAAARSWLGDNEDVPDDLPTHPLKSRLVLEGSDIFAGMRAMIEAGFMEGPLPRYMQDAPSLGGTISVVNGAVRYYSED